MNEREKLIEILLEPLRKYSIDCEVCQKMGWKCCVDIPENPPTDYEPDFSKCNFREHFIASLTSIK